MASSRTIAQLSMKIIGSRTCVPVIFRVNPLCACGAQRRMKIEYGFPLKACGNDSPLTPNP
ncbi:MAG: hypothetical protein HQ591_07525 [candidate division Zixibacteria bacterium]|nr:hypothetical protein [Candidatus Tariuqbacter arcticus]